jgi:hypothetical protein
VLLRAPHTPIPPEPDEHPATPGRAIAADESFSRQPASAAARAHVRATGGGEA